MRQAHLICLREENPDVLDAIRRVWPDDHRVELNDTAILVSHRYGGSSVYELIHDAIASEETTRALIVRVGRAHHGYENRSLWAWIQQNTSEPTSLPSRSRYGFHSLRMRSGAIRMNTIVGNTLRCLGFRTRSK